METSYLSSVQSVPSSFPKAVGAVQSRDKSAETSHINGYSNENNCIETDEENRCNANEHNSSSNEINNVDNTDTKSSKPLPVISITPSSGNQKSKQSSSDRELSENQNKSNDESSSPESGGVGSNSFITASDGLNQSSENSLHEDAIYEYPTREIKGHLPSAAVTLSSEGSLIPPPSIIVTSPGNGFLSEQSPSPASMVQMSRDGEPIVDSDSEDYFEEFHLPNTHENAFVRHLSFRRKVQTTPIHAPDAETIEGLVRTGEFARHGSIRKRILPEEDLLEEVEYEEDGDEGESKENHCLTSYEAGDSSGDIDIGIKEIEKYLSEENLDITLSELSQDAMTPDETRNKLKRCFSTPISSVSDDNSRSTAGKENSNSIQNMTFNEFQENVSIEESTLRKIRECLDYTTYRNLLNLSGRLSDLLSPQEVEEVLSHSERYREYLNLDILEALSLSYQSNVQNISKEEDTSANLPRQVDGCLRNDTEDSTKSVPNTDSGFSSPKTVKDENPQEFCSQGEYNAKNGSRHDMSLQDISSASEKQFLLHQVSVPVDGIAAEGIFIESQTPSSHLRKIIPAPIDFESSCDGMGLDSESDTSTEITNILETNGNFRSEIGTLKRCDEHSGSIEEALEYFPEENEEGMTYRKMISVTDGAFESSVDEDFDGEGFADAGVRERSGSISDSMRNLECITLNNSTSSLSSDGGLALPSDLHPLPDKGLPPPPDLIPELTASEELAEERHWRNVVIGGAWRRIDMKVIAPYKKCISHGGYMEATRNPVVMISSVFLPEKSRRDYHYVMDNLFIYVLSYVEQLASDDYVLVYLAGGRQSGGPGFNWMKMAYEMIDRRLRKNLKALLVVHPSFWARALVALSKPFISSKFYRKLHFIRNLTELAQIIPLDQLDIPDAVKQADFEIMLKEKRRKVEDKVTKI